jgi:hypothetical protein
MSPDPSPCAAASLTRDTVSSAIHFAGGNDNYTPKVCLSLHPGFCIAALQPLSGFEV